MHLVQMIPLASIKPNPRNARTHSKKQIAQIATSMKEFGFTVPVLVNEELVLLAGHGRLEAAKALGLTEVPAVMSKGLSEARQRALMLADNKIAANAGWDREKLAFELPELSGLLVLEELDISLTGFDAPEIDALVADFEDQGDPADEIEPGLLQSRAVTIPGDIWCLGAHRLACGDARREGDLATLMNGEKAAMAFLDPPYNVAVRGIVGRGKVKHREFAMASGEMAAAEFTRFLVEVLGAAKRVSAEGSVHFVCMDWRHIGDLVGAGQAVYDEFLNLIVWVKTNAGQGSFYRSQHELIAAFRVGEKAHRNNIELGKHGRSRSNVWRYAGVNTFKAGRLEELHAHPTVKPIGMVVDAIKDCTRRGDVILDTFSGSGTTLLAAERIGRRGFAMEIDPHYVDLAIRRWQAFTGRDAVHKVSGKTFGELATEREEHSRPLVQENAR